MTKFMVDFIKFKLRWWKWALWIGGPNILALIQAGADKESRRMIYRRWDEGEPKDPRWEHIIGTGKHRRVKVSESNQLFQVEIDGEGVPEPNTFELRADRNGARLTMCVAYHRPLGRMIQNYREGRRALITIKMGPQLINMSGYPAMPIMLDLDWMSSQVVNLDWYLVPKES